MRVRKALKVILGFWHGRLVNDGAITSVIELMEEVGVMGPDGSRDEFNLGHIAYHMPGRMSSK